MAAGDGPPLNPGVFIGLAVLGLAVAIWLSARSKKKVRPTIVQYLVYFEQEPELDFAQVVQQVQNHPALRTLIGPTERKYLSDIRLHISLMNRAQRRGEFINLEAWDFPTSAEIRAVSESNFALRIFFASETALADEGYLTMMECLAHVLALRYGGKAIVDTESESVFLPKRWAELVFSESKDHRVRRVMTETPDAFQCEIRGLGKWGHRNLGTGEFPLDTRASIEHGVHAFLSHFFTNPLEAPIGTNYDYLGVPQRAEVTQEKSGETRLRFFRINSMSGD